MGNRRGEDISDVDPFRFEDLVKEALDQHYDPGAVRKIGGRKDRWIDLLLFESTDSVIV